MPGNVENEALNACKCWKQSSKCLEMLEMRLLMPGNVGNEALNALKFLSQSGICLCEAILLP